jgi:hypothetical protein
MGCRSKLPSRTPPQSKFDEETDFKNIEGMLCTARSGGDVHVNALGIHTATEPSRRAGDILAEEEEIQVEPQ